MEKTNIKKRLIICLIFSVVIAIATIAAIKLINNKQEDLPELRSLSLEEVENMKDVEVHIEEEDGTDILIAGQFTKTKVINEQEAINLLYTVKEILKIDSIENEFKVLKNDKFMEDNNYRIQQYYNGILVDGMQLIVTADKDRNVKSLSGNYLKIEDIDTEPQIEQSKVEEIIKNKYGTEIKITDNQLEINKINEKPLLVWAVSTEGTYSNLEGNSYLFYVDANTGEILKEQIKMYTAYEKANCSSIIDGKKVTFEAARNENDAYELMDLDRKIVVGRYATQDSATQITTNNQNEWNDVVAVKAYKGIQNIYDFYNVKFNYNLTAEKPIFAGVHNTGTYKNNAYYISNKDLEHISITIGEGDGTEFNNFAEGLDVIAHEMTHAYVDLTLGGFKNGEINEAYADIMGNIIENYYEEKETVKPLSENENLTFSNDPNWLIGENVTISSNGVRGLANPEQHKNAMPAIIKGKNYNTGILGTGIFVNEHDNCTVLGHTSYLMWKEGYTTDEISYIFTNSCTRLNARASYADVGRMLITISNEMCPEKTRKLREILAKQRILQSEEAENIETEKVSTKGTIKADYFYEYNGDIYYWKLSDTSRSNDELFCNYKDIPGSQNELIKRDQSGNETVVYTGEGSKDVCIVNDRIFLSRTMDEYENSRMMYSIKLDGTDKKDHIEGIPEYVVGEYIIYTEKGGSICALNTKDYQTTEISKQATQQKIITCIDDIIYYYKYDYTDKSIGIGAITEAQSDIITKIKISKEYGEGFEELPLEIAYMWVDDKINMYIDYRAGTANIINGIVKVTMDKDLKNAVVTKVQTTEPWDSMETAKNGIFEALKEENGKYVTYLMKVDEKTGEIQTILNETNLKEKYNLKSDDEHYLNLYTASQVGDNIYMVLDNGIHSPEKDAGWRYSYKREKTICLKYNIETEEITSIFEF